MMAKVYRFKGGTYCDKDLSMEDDSYSGDLLDLYFELRRYGLAGESTVYYNIGCADAVYSEAEEMVEEQFADLCIGETEG